MRIPENFEKKNQMHLLMKMKLENFEILLLFSVRFFL